MCHRRMCVGWKCCLDTAVTSPGSFGPAVPALLFQRAEHRHDLACSACRDPARALSVRACCPQVIPA